MFDKANNALSAGRRFSWLYPLIVTAIALPVLCVLWLLHEATKSEQEVLANLVEEAQDRALEGFEDALFAHFEQNLKKATLLNAESRFSPVRVVTEVARLDLANAVVVHGEGSSYSLNGEREAKALLERANAILEERGTDFYSRLFGLIESDEARAYRLKSGRNAALMVLIMAIDALEFKEEIPAHVQQTIDSVIEGRLQFEVPLAQYSYFCRKYGEYSNSRIVRKIIQSLDLSENWVESVGTRNSNSMTQFHWGGVVGFRNEKGNVELLFKESRFIEIARSLDSRFEVFYSNSENVGEYAEVRPLKASLAGFSIGLRESMSPGSTERIRLYVLIGAIVLILSVLSGVVTLLLMFKQRDAAQLKNDLVATVTHELKTPVASIRLLVDTMLDPSRSDFVDTREYLNLIEKENRRLGYLIDNFLSFSRMEREKSSFDLRETDAREVAETACGVLRDRFKGVPYTLELKCVHKVPNIMADPEALATALGNLLENALKYGGVEPDVELRLEKGEFGALFSIIDQGDGIPKADQKKIFRKFYQGKRMLSNHVGGVGLGLSIVSFIVSKHLGKVSVKSEIGSGSCFTITIPYA